MKCVRSFCLLFCMLLLVLLSACSGSLGQPQTYPTWVVEATPAAWRSGLNVSADPRMELLAVVQSLGSYDSNYRLLTDYDFPYKHKIAERFAPFKDHEAVRVFDKMSKGGFSFDAPPAAMLYLSNPPELAVEMPFTNEIIARAGGPKQLEAFLKALRAFARDSDFMAFYAENQPFYEAIATEANLLVNKEDLRVLEDYYGMRQHSYNIVLAPLFHDGGFGPRVQRADGGADLFSITGPDGTVGDLPIFGSRAGYRSLIWHEFGHSFVNPLTEQHRAEVDKYASLLNPIRDEMGKQAYSDWDTVVNEHIIRAVTARMAFLVEGPEAGQRALEYERGRHFTYVDALYERLAEYEANRTQYPTFADFYPRLIAVFEEAQ